MLTLRGFIAPFVIDRPVNRVVFEAYVEKVLLPELRADDIVVMDKLSSRKGAGQVLALLLCKWMRCNAVRDGVGATIAEKGDFGMTIIDIGCGRKKIPGSIGIDSSEMSDADICIDLNVEKLPFDEGSVDFACSSHTLEHLTKEGFFHVMREVYRVLKPGGQFHILVPYFATQSNLANPFHNNDLCFNEHTFRYFSSEEDTPALDKIDYAGPSIPQWGLRYSANFELGMEFRTRRIKFYYYPYVRDLPEQERRALRSRQTDVVDQISFSLEAIKPCPIRPETGPVADGVDPYVFIDQQRSYLESQLNHIRKLGRFPPDYTAIEMYSQSIERVDDLFAINGSLVPAPLLVFELDDAIQYLRRHIDAK